MLASAILVVRLKQSEDSFEVFKDLVHLSITSKELKNIIDDKILVNLSYRYVRGRSRFVLAKLRYFARNNDINGFEKFADLVLDHYSELEAVRIFNNMLLYSTQHSDCRFLQSYLDFIAEQNLSLLSLAQYKADPPHKDEPFMGFHPNTLIKSLKIAQKNGWTDKMTVLFDLVMGDQYLDEQNLEHDQLIIAIKKEISTIHLGALGSLLMLMYHHTSQRNIRIHPILTRVLNDAKNNPDLDHELVFCSKVWLDGPIEERPWFHGSVSSIDLNNKLNGPSRRNSFLGAFWGSTICFYTYKKKKLVRKELTKENIGRVPNYFAMRYKKEAKDMHLYHLYCRLVANDLEGAKHIQQQHEIDWSSVRDQPHPLLEYLNRVDDIKDDMIEWLFNSMPPVKKFGWERKEIPDRHHLILKRILEGGAKIGTEFLILLLRKEMPVKTNFMALLSKAWDYQYSDKKVFKFIFEDLSRHYEKYHMISEKKYLLLLAWKFDQSSLFNTLPLEIIHTLIHLIDEPSLVYQLASAMAQTGVKIEYEISKEWFEKFRWGIKFVAENSTRFTYGGLKTALISFRDCKYKVFRRDYPSVKQLLETVNFNFSQCKIIGYLVKHEREPTFFEKFRSLYTGNSNEVIEALKTRNEVALKFLLGLKHYDRIPTTFTFNRSIKPKHKLTHEEAVTILRSTEEKMRK